MIDMYNKLSNFWNTTEEDSAKCCSAQSKVISLMRHQSPLTPNFFHWAQCLDWKMTVPQHTNPGPPSVIWQQKSPRIWITPCIKKTIPTVFKAKFKPSYWSMGYFAPISQRTVPRQKIFYIVTPGHHIQFFRPFVSGHLSLQFCQSSEGTQRLHMHNLWSNLPAAYRCVCFSWAANPFSLSEPIPGMKSRSFTHLDKN